MIQFVSQCNEIELKFFRGKSCVLKCVCVDSNLFFFVFDKGLSEYTWLAWTSLMSTGLALNS